MTRGNEMRTRLLRTVALDILYVCEMLDTQEDEIAKLRKRQRELEAQRI